MRAGKARREQTERRGRPYAVALAAVVVCSVAAWTVGVTSAQAEPLPNKTSGPTFPVSGSVDGLSPGVEHNLLLTVGNPFGYGITVTRLTVHVGDADATCGASFLDVPDWTGRLAIPPRGERTQALAVTMTADAPEACKDATWPLTFDGSADRTATAGGQGSQTSTSEQRGGALAFTGSPVAILFLLAVLTIASGLLARRLSRGQRHEARSAASTTIGEGHSS